MRYLSAACALSVFLMAVSGRAQTPAPSQAPDPQLVPPPAWAFNDLACAPQLALDVNAPLPALRVLGSQDGVIRGLLGPGDMLVVTGGSNAGLQTGQRYFVRRLVTTRGGLKVLPPTIHTAAWVQILGVDTSLATATVVHACDGILLDDYLEPFVAPTIAERAVPGSTPQYENMGHIVTAGEGFHTVAVGQMTTIDRGTNSGIIVGQRFLVFRDKRDQTLDRTGKSEQFAELAVRLPLVEIGEVLVVAVRPEDSTVQVITSKDAITTGDLIAPIR